MLEIILPASILSYLTSSLKRKSPLALPSKCRLSLHVSSLPLLTASTKPSLSQQPFQWLHCFFYSGFPIRMVLFASHLSPAAHWIPIILQRKSQILSMANKTQHDWFTCAHLLFSSLLIQLQLYMKTPNSFLPRDF